MSRRLRYLYAVLIAAALTMAVAGVTLTTNLVSEATHLQVSFRDNPTGVAAQADYELLTLIDRLENWFSMRPSAQCVVLPMRWKVRE